MTEVLQSHFLNLYAFALADSQIETAELEALYKIGLEKGIQKSEIDQILLSPDKIRFRFPDNLDEKVIYLYDFARIILADGIVDQNERKTLELFCARFGFEEENVPTIADFLIESARENIDIKNLLQSIQQNLN